jgi:hypothetical protein
MSSKQQGRRKRQARDFYERRRWEREEPWSNESARIDQTRQDNIKRIMELGGQVKSKERTQ